MDERPRLLAAIFYGALLGWFIRDWWRAERDRITWDAAERADELAAHRQRVRENAAHWAAEAPPSPTPADTPVTP